MDELRGNSVEPGAVDAGDVDPLLTLIASVGRKIFGAFEHEIGMIPPMYFMLHAVASEDRISQAALSRLFEVVSTRVTRLAQKMEADGFIRRARTSSAISKTVWSRCKVFSFRGLYTLWALLRPYVRVSW